MICDWCGEDVYHLIDAYDTKKKEFERICYKCFQEFGSTVDKQSLRTNNQTE